MGYRFRIVRVQQRLQSHNKVNRRLTSYNLNLFIVYKHVVWGLDFFHSRIYSQYLHPLSPYANFLLFSFLLAFFSLIICCRNGKKNNLKIMPIQSRNCEWESGDVNCMYIICFDVIRSTGNMLYFAVKNKSISDIAVLLLKIKPLPELCVTASRGVSGSIVLGFLLCDFTSCLWGTIPHCWHIYSRTCYKRGVLKLNINTSSDWPSHAM